jgi:hypothetical protein
VPAYFSSLGLPFKSLFPKMATWVMAAIFAGCTTINPALQTSDTAYALHTADGQLQVRALTQAATCPNVKFDQAIPVPMNLRAASSNSFPVSSCELHAPQGAKVAQVGVTKLPLAATPATRIVVLGDSGCRLKDSDNAFQACNHPTDWPFAQVAQAAAAWKPDMVVHLGDMHYRESPCPSSHAGCEGSPSGYGFDTWAADFFIPAKPLLQAAPWVFVRGNHESCSRAGEGWIRFMASASVNGVNFCQNFSEPYAVPIGHASQFIVFDSAHAGSKPYTPTDPIFQIYLRQFEQITRLSTQAQSSIFLSHHPVLAFTTNEKNKAVYGGTPSLQSVMQVVNPQRLFPPGVKLALHAHSHFFESVSFASDHPDTLVVGNAGSSLYPELPKPLPQGAEVAPFTEIAHIQSVSKFGFMTLELQPQGWLATLRDVQGAALVQCVFLERLTCAVPNGLGQSQ